VLVAADGDRALPPKVARQTAALVPGSELIVHKSYGHLSHEEAPEETAELIVRAAQASGIAVGWEGNREQQAPARPNTIPEQPVQAAA
jgi:magnesium chelatase accessory protein